jgi:2-dehydro-3-deoxyphosphogluconate aldolase / (4S)-4-hydroxy-2-oxoglutarate aldolase
VTNKHEVRARIEEIGIIPSLRTASADEARFAAETVSQAGIPLVEVTMTVPGALKVIADLVRKMPDLVAGAGTVLDIDVARRCVDAGAKFLTSPGFDLRVVEFAIKEDVLVLAGALTPTEVMAAWQAGADLVKVFPCAQLGGATYIKALKGPFPQVPLVAAGGVNQQTAADFIVAGAVAVGVGAELIPRRALEQREPAWILELAHRFLSIIKEARRRTRSRHESVPDRDDRPGHHDRE